MGPLGTELRRAVAMNPTTSLGSGGGEMLLWDGVGLEGAQISELSERLGLRIQHGDGLALLGVSADSGSGSDEQPGRLAPAMALAKIGTNRSVLPFDFTRSRLAAPKVRKVG